MLRAILFDAAGTLIHLPRSVGEHYAEVVAAGFGAHLPPAALDAAFREAWKAMPERPATPDGRPRPDDDKGWWRALVARVLAQTWPAADRPGSFDEAACFEKLYAHFSAPGVWAAFPEARETLAALRARGLRLAVVSNFDRRLLAVLEHLGLREFFGTIILSSEAGADKPDPRMFHRALAALDVSLDEALHVGDDPAKDWGAERIGLRVFRLDRPGNSLRELLTEIGAGRP